MPVATPTSFTSVVLATFGPRTRHEQAGRLTRGAARRVLAGALTHHTQSGTLSIINFGETLPKTTREAAKFFRDEHGVLLLLAAEHSQMKRAVRNLANVRALAAHRVSMHDLAGARAVWVDAAALAVLAERCRKV